MACKLGGFQMICTYQTGANGSDPEKLGWKRMGGNSCVCFYALQIPGLSHNSPPPYPPPP